jgi:hypothetical protein
VSAVVVVTSEFDDSIVLCHHRQLRGECDRGGAIGKREMHTYKEEMQARKQGVVLVHILSSRRERVTDSLKPPAINALSSARAAKRRAPLVTPTIHGRMECI